MDHLTAALAYAKQGFAVFPLAPRSKLPLIPAREGSHGLHDATTDLDQIGAWWTAHPTANIGLGTGVRFDRVDVDGEAAVDAIHFDVVTVMSLSPLAMPVLIWDR
jgi:Bifunctional DNA primase/polymerase, N-terminal